MKKSANHVNSQIIFVGKKIYNTLKLRVYVNHHELNAITVGKYQFPLPIINNLLLLLFEGLMLLKKLDISSG